MKKQNQAKQNLRIRRIKIKIVGIGGGGAAIVSEVAKGVRGVSFSAVDCDEKCPVRDKNKVRMFQMGTELSGGFGTGMNPELGEKIAQKEKERMAKIFKGQDLLILIASLGGGFGSGAAPVFAELARELKNISLGIFTLPFRFEGEKKEKIAKTALAKLRSDLSGQIVISNERVFQIIDKKTPLRKALNILNKTIISLLSDLVDLISRPGLINIDFADLKTILRGRGRLIWFGSAEKTGANRAEEAIKAIFQNPLWPKPLFEVKRILFNITGSKDLTLKEVQVLSKGVCDLNPRAKIIFGISENPKYNGKIKIMLLAVGPELKEEKTTKKSRAKEKGPEKKKRLLLKTKTEKPKSKTRRSALEIKKEEKQAELEQLSQEKEWEIPAFLRKRFK